MYAISTCIWCKRAKRFLSNHQIEYEYIDVDLISQEDLQHVERDIKDRKGQLLFPTIIVDDQMLLTNPQEEQLRQVLEIE